MDNLSTGALFGFSLLLVVVSAYFSGSETAMMALNRYRLKHLAKQGHGGARRAAKLLERPDRLLGVILIGNNLANFTAASLATLLALKLLGDSGVAVAPVVCTLVFLVFAEVAPKTIAAVYPERIALPSSYLLQLLLWLLYPAVWLVNALSNKTLKPLGVSQEDVGEDHLSPEELHTVVKEGSSVAGQREEMLLSVLGLDKVTVEDIMVPKAEIVGIDIQDDLDDILQQLRATQHTRLPVFEEEVDKVTGMLHLRNAAKFLLGGEQSKEALLKETLPPYFVPETTPLLTQLFNFQAERQRIALVVDEYGDVQGMVTLEDILEEIVGDFTTDAAAVSRDIHPQDDGSYLVDGSAHLRQLNRSLGWQLPVDGPKTLNGLITETLEAIPESNVGLVVDGYRMEIIQIQENMIKTVKIWAPGKPL